LTGGPSDLSIGASVPVTAAGVAFCGTGFRRDIHQAPPARNTTIAMAMIAIGFLSSMNV
jgi:hypothetical protein